ncbi:MAG: glucuronate isomerase [Saprospiraceae bacterium]|jgi:glucuronate isomerase|nr:glucuronate isomerase [Saprospiraceae bacterium]
MTSTIFHDDFLLQSQMARRLYHGHAADLPILDYHNHLPPAEIAEDKRFATLTEIWLKGDHYKWRAMRALGVDENLVTGTATDEEKFMAWAACLPKTLRNPLFHWSHLELKNYFGINAYLNKNNAAEVYSICNELLQTNEYSTQNLLHKFKVELVGTTDDPCDDLMHHKAFNDKGFGFIMRPSFRPDKALNIGDKTAFTQYLKQLEKASGINISTYENLLEALKNRVDYFHQNGCRIADHGLVQMPPAAEFSRSLQREFAEFVSGESKQPFSSPAAFAGIVLLELCRMYHERGWVQQFHLGPLRNTNSRQLARLGADAGVDSIGDLPQAAALAQFLDALDRTDQLAKTILYNINPADNEAFATMCGNFQDGKIRGKIQFGSGWWFLDQLDGMEKQINVLSNMGILSTFIGMTTDSRSFLSFPRHEYFRRLLCNILGNDVERGLLPNDEEWLGGLVADICYHNAKTYFI